MGQNFLAGGLVIQLEVNKFGLDLWRMGKEKSGTWMLEDWEDGNASRASFATEESYFKKELFGSTSTIFNDFLLGLKKLEHKKETTDL